MVARHDVTWIVSETARSVVAQARQLLGDAYEEDKRALQDFLCQYFTANDQCDRRFGNSVSVLGATDGGAKKLKVRWKWPGRGKRQGLRLGILVNCKLRIAKIAAAYIRERDPSDADFDADFVAAEEA